MANSYSAVILLTFVSIFADRPAILFAQEVKYTNICFQTNSTQETPLDLTCNASQRIDVLESYYYENKYEACFFQQGDCKEKEEKVISLCNERRTCHLKIKKIYSVLCSGYVSLLRVVYQCQQDKYPVDENGQLGAQVTMSETNTDSDIQDDSQTEWGDVFQNEEERTAMNEAKNTVQKSKQFSDNKVMILAAASVAGVVGFISIVVIIVLIIKNCQYSDSDENANSILDEKTANCLKSFLLKQKVISVRERPVGTEHPSPVRQQGGDEKVHFRDDKGIFERGVEQRDVEAQRVKFSENGRSFPANDRAFALAAHLSEIIVDGNESYPRLDEPVNAEIAPDLKQLSPTEDDDAPEFNVVLQPLQTDHEAEDNIANSKVIECCDAESDEE